MDRAEMITILQVVLLLLGTKELFEARAYYRQQKKKWVAASLCMAVFAFACAVVSMTGVV